MTSTERTSRCEAKGEGLLHVVRRRRSGSMLLRPPQQKPPWGLMRLFKAGVSESLAKTFRRGARQAGWQESDLDSRARQAQSHLQVNSET